MRPTTPPVVQTYLYNLTAVVLTVFVLHVAKPVVLPVALALLGAFLLIPVVALIQRMGMGRTPAVLVTMLLASAVVGGVGWVVVSETNALVRELPNHKQEIKTKVDQLRGAGGPFSELVKMVKEIGTEPEATAAPQREVVVARLDEGSPVSRIVEPALIALEPVAMVGVILVLVVFVLVGREDLRSRLLAMLGRSRLVGTVRVLGDSSQRVGKFLLFQLLVNAGVGFVFAIGLAVIGVPHSWLWGFLTAVLRFIPYVGTWVSVLFPLALTFATTDGWQKTLLVFGYFAVLDLFVSNVVEPLLFGHHTGVSPIALLVSAVFWTWVWGPVGLVLATPLTVCLVVIGLHIPQLHMLTLLLGDRPALKPQVDFYQRLLAKDATGAAAVVTAVAAKDGLALAYDEVVIPALALTRLDRHLGGLTVQEERDIYTVVRLIMDELRVSHQSPAPAASGMVFLGAPAHDAVEELPIAMIGEVLRREGHQFEMLHTGLLPAEVEDRVARTGATAVVISIMPPGGLAQAGYLCRRLRKRFPDLIIVPVWWGKEDKYDQLLVRLRKRGASYLTTSLTQTCSQLQAAQPTPPPMVGHHNDSAERVKR